MRSQFSLLGGNCSKNVINCGADNSSSVHADNKKKKILVLGERLRQWLDNTTITAEVKCFIDFTDSRIKFCVKCAL